MSKKPRSILLVRPDGIGDQILCLPVASALRIELPQAKIGFLSSVYAAPLLELHPDLDEVIPCSHHDASFEELVGYFKRYDAAIFLKPYKHLFRAAFKAGVSYRVGTGFRWYSFLLNCPVFKHRKKFDRHESQSNLELLEGLGLKPREVVPPRLFLADTEAHHAAKLLGAWVGHRVVLHLGGFSPRPWLPEYFFETLRILASSGYQVVLTGSVEERRRISGLGQQPADAAVVDLTGQLSLRHLMAVIALCDLTVSLSTGPMHIAAALSVPAVSIFDPRRSSSPARWRPLGRGVVLMPDVPTCEKCSLESCRWWDCMAQITPQIVVSMIDGVLSGRAGMNGVDVVKV